MCTDFLEESSVQVNSSKYMRSSALIMEAAGFLETSKSHTLMKAETCSSETTLQIYQTSRRYIQKMGISILIAVRTETLIK
jgi:hypothetical protein